MLSGAYAVLSGAPALVAAVDRYALADSARPAVFVTPEVRAALGEQVPPWFDASALRDGGQKLGLGSSAAILVASLAALELSREPALTDLELASKVYERALVAHRAAQGGGSGVDVAASSFGGVLSAQRSDAGLVLCNVCLPRELHFEVWACAAAASTPALLARVAELGVRNAGLHRALIAVQTEASVAAHVAALADDAPGFIRAIDRQECALRALGESAGANIVTPELAQLAELARTQGAAFLPAGAGGGDVAYYVGVTPAPPSWGARARALGLSPVELSLGARGVHAAC